MVTTDEPISGADAVEALKSAGVLDDVLARIDAGQLQLTGQGGFLPEMVKAVLERGPAAELTDHLGYEKGDPLGRELPNARNGIHAPTPPPDRARTLLPVTGQPVFRHGPGELTVGHVDGLGDVDPVPGVLAVRRMLTRCR